MEVQNYFNLKERAARLPSVQVSRDEFIRRLKERGETPEKAEQMAMVAEALGSQIEINNEMVGIVNEE